MSNNLDLDVDAVWEDVVRYLRETDENPDALLAQAARQLEAWRSIAGAPDLDVPEDS